MFKSKLTRKILAIIALTLFTGFACMGVTTIYLQYRSTMELQRQHARTLAGAVTHDMLNLMMKGDMKEFDSYIDNLNKNTDGVAIQVFDTSGKERRGRAVNNEMLAALNSGMKEESTGVVNDRHVLNLIVPLNNEERCRSCHSADKKYLGGHPDHLDRGGL